VEDISAQSVEHTGISEDSISKEEVDLDQVEEAEEGPETAIEGRLEEDDNDVQDPLDPFETHFADPDDNILSRRLKALEKQSWTTQKSQISKIGKAVISIPDDGRSEGITVPGALSGPGNLKLKHKLAGSFTKHTTTFDPLEQVLAPCIFNYHDVLFCERTVSNAEQLRRLTCLHAINHVFK
jgi:U3 small nucleolar RNA-associated protein 25